VVVLITGTQCISHACSGNNI